MAVITCECGRRWNPVRVAQCPRCGVAAELVLPEVDLEHSEPDRRIESNQDAVSLGQNPGQKFCTRCGNARGTQDKYCGSCGNALHSSVTTARHVLPAISMDPRRPSRSRETGRVPQSTVAPAGMVAVGESERRTVYVLVGIGVAAIALVLYMISSVIDGGGSSGSGGGASFNDVTPVASEQAVQGRWIEVCTRGQSMTGNPTTVNERLANTTQWKECTQQWVQP